MIGNWKRASLLLLATAAALVTAGSALAGTARGALEPVVSAPHAPFADPAALTKLDAITTASRTVRAGKSRSTAVPQSPRRQSRQLANHSCVWIFGGQYYACHLSDWSSWGWAGGTWAVYTPQHQFVIYWRWVYNGYEGRYYCAWVTGAGQVYPTSC